MTRFIQVHAFDEYIDFEPDTVMAINGMTRITFDSNKHSAYATMDDPLAPEKLLTWDEATALVTAEY